MIDFFPGNSFEDFAQRLDGGELPVRIENVEFRVVGGECRAGVFGDGGFSIRRRCRIGQLRERRFVAGHQGVDGLLKQFAVVREIRDDFQRVAKGDDGRRDPPESSAPADISARRASSAANLPLAGK